MFTFESSSQRDCPRRVSAPPNHEVRPSPNKGLGIFATQFIAQGSPILLEAPLVSIPMPSKITSQGFRITDMVSDITSAFGSLPLSDQNIFLSLHDHRFPSEQDQSHLLTIFRSNAFNIEDDRIGLFPKLARINHSCRPNAGNGWSEKTQKRVIYAMRDIGEGEEITVSYIPLLKPTSERQARLAQYGFLCDCAACKDESGEGDKRRVRIGEWLDDLEGKVGRQRVKEEVGRKRIEKALRLMEMVEGEGLGDYAARAYRLVAVFNEHVGDLEEARVWAEKEQEVLGWAKKESDEALVSSEFIESREEVK
jgi:hypothetical protein